MIPTPDEIQRWHEYRIERRMWNVQHPDEVVPLLPLEAFIRRPENQHQTVPGRMTLTVRT